MGLCARDIMESPVKTVSADMTLIELERALLADHVTGYPVVEGTRLVGIVSRSDIVRQLSVEQNLAEQLSASYRDPGNHPDEEAGAEAAAVSLRVAQRLGALLVKDVMVHDLVTVEPEATLESVARLMVSRHIHRLPVTEAGVLVGIVSAFDLVRLFADGRARV